MENLLYTFEPSNTSDNITLIIAILVALISLIGLLYLLKGKNVRVEKNLKLVLAMLCFFCIANCFGNCLFFSLVKDQDWKSLSL